MIYLDNGATSFPKPRQVTDAVLEAMTQYCANPGRSSHFLAARTAQEIYKTRAVLALTDPVYEKLHRSVESCAAWDPAQR